MAIALALPSMARAVELKSTHFRGGYTSQLFFPKDEGRQVSLIPALHITSQNVANGELGRKSCSRIAEVTPPIAMGFVLVTVLAGLIWRTRRGTLADGAKLVMLLAQFTSAFNFTVVILDAYQLSKAMGQGATFSGLLIGMYMLFLPLGSLVVWMVLRHSPEVWQTRARSGFIAALMFNSIGAMLYAIVEILAFSGLGNASAWQVYGLVTCACCARAATGIGGGICNQMCQALFAKMIPVRERPHQMVRLTLVTMLGVGLGPLVAAALHTFKLCPASRHVFESVGLVQLAAALGMLITVAACFPSLSNLREEAQNGYQGSDAETLSLIPREELARRRTVLCGCLTMTALRGFVLSGLEASTALLLESHYGWDLSVIGLAIACTLLGCIPAKMLFDSHRARLVLSTWIRFFVLISLLGCIFLFPRICWLLNENYCAQFLILADVLLFPCLFLGDALQRIGIMQQHLWPDGSMWDANCTALAIVCVTGLAQFLGPWLARWCIVMWGQDGYALQQLIITSVFVLLFEFAVSPRISTVRK